VVSLIRACAMDAGIAVSRFNDVPDPAAMRSVAMLANEAADAVGLSKVSHVLTNLGQTYGEERYRVSPLIQHHIFAEKSFHG